MFLYYVISGKIYNKENQVKGVLNSEDKSRGANSITKYRRRAVDLIDVFLLQQFAKF
jgi:hypothetical protein